MNSHPTARTCIVILCLVAWAGGVDAAESPLTASARADLRRQVSDLQTEIARHDRLYHQDARPEISDREYDLLRNRLRELEASNPEIAADVTGATQSIGDDRTGLFQTRLHRERMLSLDKAYTEADIRAFDARLARAVGRTQLEYVVEPKVDGLAVSVVYEQGQLVRAVTRGNGVEGDDITANLDLIRELPRSLRATGDDGTANPIPEAIELRGEIHVTFENFRLLNAEREAAGDMAYANPRNFAAGVIRQVGGRALRRPILDIVFFGVGGCLPESARPATQHELHEQIARWGLPGLEPVLRVRGPDAAWAAIQSVGRTRAALDFPTDGAVVKLDAVASQQILGASETAPRWAMAFKFATPAAETQVRGITIQVGRTGVLTPVAELVPVEISGSTVTRATLHNRDEIARLDLRVGDFVAVEKAGEIIPAIVSVNKARRPASAAIFAWPSTCPACGTGTVQRPDEVAVFCPNYDCPAQVRRRIEHFASREAVNIEGLGPATIDRLVTAGRLKDVADVYALTRADFVTASAKSGASVSQVLAAIEASKTRETWRFIYGLGIPQIGLVAAKEAASRYATLAALLAIEPGNDSTSQTLASFVADPRLRSTIEQLVACGVQPGVVVTGAQRLRGKVFVLTGTLPNLTRAQATEKIEAAGGRVAGSVTSATDYVVAGKDPGAKLEQAKARGTAILDEQGLLRLLVAE